MQFLSLFSHSSGIKPSAWYKLGKHSAVKLFFLKQDFTINLPKKLKILLPQS